MSMIGGGIGAVARFRVATVLAAAGDDQQDDPEEGNGQTARAPQVYPRALQSRVKVWTTFGPFSKDRVARANGKETRGTPFGAGQPAET
jgi:hypothetical protein